MYFDGNIASLFFFVAVYSKVVRPHSQICVASNTCLTRIIFLWINSLIYIYSHRTYNVFSNAWEWTCACVVVHAGVRGMKLIDSIRWSRPECCVVFENVSIGLFFLSISHSFPPYPVSICCLVCQANKTQDFCREHSTRRCHVAFHLFVVVVCVTKRF